MIDVVAAIIRLNGKILITKRRGNVHLPGFWEFPGGKVEAGETFVIALQREIREEIGVIVDVFDELVTTVHHYEKKSVRLHFFECAIVSGDLRAIEVADMKWVTPSELDQFHFPEADMEIIAHLRKP